MPHPAVSSNQVRVAKKVLKRTGQTRAKPTVRTPSSCVDVDAGMPVQDATRVVLPLPVLSQPCADDIRRIVGQKDASHVASPQAPKAAKRVSFAKQVEYHEPPKRTWLFGRALGGRSQKAEGQRVGVGQRIAGAVAHSQKLQLRALKCIFAGM